MFFNAVSDVCAFLSRRGYREYDATVAVAAVAAATAKIGHLKSVHEVVDILFAGI